jgi:inorganic pyrophosphatase
MGRRARARTKKDRRNVKMDFWESIDALVAATVIEIDRAEGTTHPRFPELKYPIDYGFLKDTKGNDGSEIDVWRGSNEAQTCDAIVCTIDHMKMDSEIKLLIGCSEFEKDQVLTFHNMSEHMAAIIIRRPQ